MAKSEGEETRSFAFEGDNEHQIVEQQLKQMARARNKASEQWTAQATVLRELIDHHVKEEEVPASTALSANLIRRSWESLANNSVARRKSCWPRPDRPSRWTFVHHGRGPLAGVGNSSRAVASSLL